MWTLWLHCQVLAGWAGCSQFYWHPVQRNLLQLLPGSLFQSDPSFYPSSFLGSRNVHALVTIFLDLGSLLSLSKVLNLLVSRFLLPSPTPCHLFVVTYIKQTKRCHLTCRISCSWDLTDTVWHFLVCITLSMEILSHTANSCSLWIQFVQSLEVKFWASYSVTMSIILSVSILGSIFHCLKLKNVFTEK